jgi:acetyl-CoA carboxylase alpha subunit
MAANLRSYLAAGLARQLVKTEEQLLDERYRKFRRIGSFSE